MRTLVPLAALLAASCSSESGALQAKESGKQHAEVTRTSTQGEVEAEFQKWLARAEAADPYLAKTLDALKDDFPHEYHGLVRRAAEAWRLQGPKADGRQIGAQTIQSFVKANQKNIAFAPTAHLVRYAKAQAHLMEVLQKENVRVCARMAMGDRKPSEHVSAAMKMATADVAAIMIHAARAGIDSPQSHQSNGLSDTERDAYVQAIQSQNMSRDALEALAKDSLSSAPIEIQCEAGVANARAIASLAPETSAKLMAMNLLP